MIATAHHPLGWAGSGLASRELRDVDELRVAVRGWDLDFRQLGPTSNRSRLSQVAGPGGLITHLRLGASMLQSGSAPPGTRTFGLIESAGEVGWCGHAATSDSLLSFASGGSFDAVSGDDFGCVTVSVDESALERAAQDLELPEPSRLLGEGALALVCEPRVVGALRARLHQLIAGGASMAIWELLPEWILEAAASGRTKPRRSPPPERVRIMTRCREYLRDHSREPVLVRDLCRAAECNERTLRRAFIDRFGVPPQVFLKSSRLEEVRRLLLTSGPDFCVSDAANSCGFWHMGAFAADYRRQFGELPSLTLQRPVAR